MLEKKKFVRYKEKKANPKTTIISLGLNQEEMGLLKACKLRLRQPKDGTAIKQLMKIGAKTINDQKIAEILDMLFENKRKNKRLGITDDLI